MLYYFELTGIEKTDTSTTLFISEKNIRPEQYKSAKLTSKGFYEPVTIQDFPLRGKPCFLKVKRSQWLNEDTEAIVCRDRNTVAKGTRLTSEKELIDNNPISIKSLEKYFHINGKLLEHQYVFYLSDYLDWKQLKYAEDRI